MSGILTYVLHYEGEFNKNSLGAVSEAGKLAKELGVDAHAVVVGDDATDDLCKQLGNYGASKVWRAPAPAGLGGQPEVPPILRRLARHEELVRHLLHADVRVPRQRRIR